MKKKTSRKRRILLIISVLLIIAITAFGYRYNSVLRGYQQGRTEYMYTPEMDAALFPFDETEAQLIDDSQPCKDGETWAIYMYLNASNLELDGHTQLSDFVKYIAANESGKRIEAETARSRELFAEFIETEEKNNVPLPLFFYEANYDNTVLSAVPEEQHRVSDTAWGSDILNEIKNANLPDNVTFVVQPGGARAWKNVQVNPNRTRRFVKSGNELIEVYDAPVTNMGNSETLTDFLNFCKKNYPADHTMVILTDHGGAMTGFGWDNVYDDDNLTLQELTEAFDNAYGIDEKDPPIDLLYFNACLMSNTDVMNAMRGVSKYMIAGEEVGLSVSQYYGKLGDKLCENPNMNPQQLGKALIDCYVNDLADYGSIFGAPPVTGLCLLDMQKAPLVFDAYADLAGKLLGDVAENPEILAQLSRSVSESVNFAVDAYKRYNCTDLGLWVNGFSSLYPEEAKQIIDLIDDAVLYKRADSYLTDAHGISVYFPNFIEDTAALRVALKYIDSISYSDDISALYYYKLAGCLNEEFTDYCTKQGIKVPDTIDYDAMGILRNAVVTPTDEMGNVKFVIDESVYPILTDVRFELCKVDASGTKVTFYGEDRFVAADSSSSAPGIQTVFEGKWVNLDGVPLYVNVINTFENSFIYECPVIYKDFEYKLIIQCDVDAASGKDTFTILGLRHQKDDAATVSRSVEALKPGAIIRPIYFESAIEGGPLSKVIGKAMSYKANSVIQDENLTRGDYRVRIVFENMRGEDVYSAPVYFTAK